MLLFYLITIYFVTCGCRPVKIIFTRIILMYIVRFTNIRLYMLYEFYYAYTRIFCKQNIFVCGEAFMYLRLLFPFKKSFSQVSLQFFVWIKPVTPKVHFFPIQNLKIRNAPIVSTVGGLYSVIRVLITDLSRSCESSHIVH